MTNADQIAANIYDREGMDHDEDVGDGQGVTHIGGQTDAWLTRWALTAPTDRASAEKNTSAWMVLSGLIQIVNVSLPLGDALCDWCFTSGERTPTKAFQTLLGVTADGLIGSMTLAAFAKVQPSALVEPLAKARVKFLGTAVTLGEIKPAFAEGEIARALLFL